MLSSLRNFFLALFVSLLVFGTSAYFLVEFIDANANSFGSQPNNSGGDTNGDDNAADNGGPDEWDEFKDTSEFTALFIGIDSGLSQFDEQQEADLIILVNVNAKTDTLMISSLSPDMKTEVNGYILRLGAVYAEFEAEVLVETVTAYTGLQPDYYCVVDYESMEKIFAILGDVRYNVPIDMYYDPFEIPAVEFESEEGEEGEELPAEPATERPAEDTGPTEKDYERIDLTEGYQRINAEKAIQLLRFNNYTDPDLEIDRTKIQTDFFKEVLRQKLTFTNLGRAPQLFEQLRASVVETNMTSRDFENYAETLFSLSEFTIAELIYPAIRRVRIENGVPFFIPDVKMAVNQYKPYRRGVTENIINTDGEEENISGGS
jgi:anionic cell wall polymer biosynthesis LytR-Cps2A-Psr (LCP) family protein